MEACNIAWATGLFEGEGCVSVSLDGKNGRLKAKLAVVSTDEDVLRRFHSIIGFGRIWGPHPGRKAHHKPQYRWGADGWDAVRDVYQLMSPYLGSRRTARFLEVLGQEQARMRRVPGSTHCQNGHELTEDNIRLTAGGRKCRQCERDYQRKRRARKGTTNGT